MIFVQIHSLGPVKAPRQPRPLGWPWRGSPVPSARTKPRAALPPGPPDRSVVGTRPRGAALWTSPADLQLPEHPRRAWAALCFCCLSWGGPGTEAGLRLRSAWPGALLPLVKGQLGAGVGPRGPLTSCRHHKAPPTFQHRTPGAEHGAAWVELGVAGVSLTVGCPRSSGPACRNRPLCVCVGGTRGRLHGADLCFELPASFPVVLSWWWSSPPASPCTLNHRLLLPSLLSPHICNDFNFIFVVYFNSLYLNMKFSCIYRHRLGRTGPTAFLHCNMFYSQIKFFTQFPCLILGSSLAS